MNVLVGCEYSGTVRDAFISRGHDAISVDILPSEAPGPHHQGDLLNFLDWHAGEFDLAIFHPPCTYLANSGVRWLHTDYSRWSKMTDAAEFFKTLLECDIPRIAVENPIMHGYAKDIIGRGQDQVVQPWMFGHMEKKATCLWLKNLPLLQPTHDVKEVMELLPKSLTDRIHRMPPGPDRAKKRSKTYLGMALAMADQWGSLEDNHD